MSEVAAVSAKLLSQLDGDGLGAEEAEKGVETAINDWKEAQMAIAEARGVPRSTTDVYLDSRDLGTLAASRQFEDPVFGL